MAGERSGLEWRGAPTSFEGDGSCLWREHLHRLGDLRCAGGECGRWVEGREHTAWAACCERGHERGSLAPADEIKSVAIAMRGSGGSAEDSPDPAYNDCGCFVCGRGFQMIAGDGSGRERRRPTAHTCAGSGQVYWQLVLPPPLNSKAFGHWLAGREEGCRLVKVGGKCSILGSYKPKKQKMSSPPFIRNPIRGYDHFGLYLCGSVPSARDFSCCTQHLAVHPTSPFTREDLGRRPCVL